MTCYVLQAGTTDRAKIGWAARDVEARVAALQAGCWEPLRIARTMPGCRLVESWLHHHFQSQRIARDWFVFDPTMLTVVPPPIERVVAAVAAARLPGTGIGMALIRSHRGLSSKIARDLGLSSGAVAMWDKVPGERVVAVEASSGIPRHLLRPDLCLPPFIAAASVPSVEAA